MSVQTPVEFVEIGKIMLFDGETTMPWSRFNHPAIVWSSVGPFIWLDWRYWRRQGELWCYKISVPIAEIKIWQISCLLHKVGTTPFYQMSLPNINCHRQSQPKAEQLARRKIDRRLANCLPAFKVSRLMVHNAKYEGSWTFPGQIQFPYGAIRRVFCPSLVYLLVKSFCLIFPVPYLSWE